MKINDNFLKIQSSYLFSNIAKKELRSDVFYASIDNDLKDKYAELIENGTFQSKFEEFLLENL